MKKLILLLIAIVPSLALWAQTDSRHYTIKGVNINKELNGAHVYLFDDRTIVDSTEVVDGTYFLEGELDKELLLRMNVGIKKKGENFLLGAKSFYLEPANILIAHDSTAVEFGELNVKVEGTKLNEDATMLLAQVNDENFPEDMSTVLSQEWNKKYYAAIREYVIADINNPLSSDLFLDHYNNSLFSVEERLALIAQMNEQYQANEAVQYMKERDQNYLKVLPGNKLTDVIGTTPAGKKVALSKIVKKNKYTILYFNRIYSDSQIIEVKKQFQDIYKEAHRLGLEIYMINYFSSKDEWQSAMKLHKLPWINVADMEYTAYKAYAHDLQKEHPYMIIIARDGTLIDSKKLMEVLAKIVAKK